MSFHGTRFIAFAPNDSRDSARNLKIQRLIRTSAARASRSHHVYERAELHHKQSQATEVLSQRGGMNHFRLQLSPAERALIGYETTSPLNHHLSAWTPVVEPLGGKAWDLLHYYRYDFRARSWAIIAKKDWFTFIIDDPVTAHATLSFVSLNRDLEERNEISSRTLYHKVKTLNLIRQRMIVHDSSSDDSLIGAIALLAMTEGLEGHSRSSAAHVEALSALVERRGGFNQLSKNEALSRLVTWAELCHVSTIPTVVHRWKLFELSVTDPLRENAAPLIGTKSNFLESIEDIMPVDIIHLVRLLGSIPMHPPTDDTPLQQRHEVSRLIYHINQTLLLIHHDDLFLFSDAVRRLANALYYAAHFYISLVLRQMPRRTKVVTERAARLQHAIIELEAVEVWEKASIEPYLVISLWAQTLHFCSLSPDRWLYSPVCGLRGILKVMKVNDVHGFYYHLSRISWIVPSFENELQHLVKLGGVEERGSEA